MKVKPKLIVYALLIAFVLTLAAAFIENRLANVQTTLAVYTSSKTLNVGDKITKTDLSTVKVPITQLTKNNVTNPKNIIGKVVKQKIYQGEQININRLADKNDPNLFIATNSRRFSIPTSYIDDPYSLTFRAGDTVDILFSKTKTTGQSTSNLTQIVLEHAMVVGAINENGELLSESDNKTLATAILFQSSTDNIINITADQYQGKFKFVKYPDNAS